VASTKKKFVTYDEAEKVAKLVELQAKGIYVREFHYGGKYGKPKPNRWELFWEE
jgi:hypothetical protein